MGSGASTSNAENKAQTTEGKTDKNEEKIAEDGAKNKKNDGVNSGNQAANKRKKAQVTKHISAPTICILKRNVKSKQLSSIVYFMHF